MHCDSVFHATQELMHIEFEAALGAAFTWRRKRAHEIRPFRHPDIRGAKPQGCAGYSRHAP